MISAELCSFTIQYFLLVETSVELPVFWALLLWRRWNDATAIGVLEKGPGSFRGEGAVAVRTVDPEYAAAGLSDVWRVEVESVRHGLSVAAVATQLDGHSAVHVDFGAQRSGRLHSGHRAAFEREHYDALEPLGRSHERHHVDERHGGALALSEPLIDALGTEELSIDALERDLQCSFSGSLEQQRARQ